MNFKNSTLAFGIVLTGWSLLHAANPDEKEVIVENRPLRSWLQEKFNLSSEGGDKANTVLKRFCADTKTAIPALAAALEDKEELVRLAAASCLGNYCDGDVKSVLPPLLKALREDKLGHVRARIVVALAAVGLEDKAVLAALLKALKEDKDADVRTEVVCQFRHVKSQEATATVLPAVITALKDREAAVRLQAVFAVAGLREAKTRIPMVINALGDDDDNVREAAAAALGDLFPEALLLLRKALEDKNPNVRTSALYALCQAHTNDKVSPLLVQDIPVIVAMLNDKDRAVRAMAARTLGTMKAVAAVPNLILKLDDADADVRFWCIWALGEIGPDAAVAVEKLIPFLKDADPSLRGEAVETLGKIGPKAKAAVGVLVEALKDKRDHIRIEAAEALGNIGPDAKAAVPSLKEAMKAADELLKEIIEKALMKIGTDNPTACQ